jgi:hypothetical protein
MDLHLADVASPTDVDKHLVGLRSACATLGGAFTAFRYVDPKRGTNRPELVAKTKCRLKRRHSAPLVPVVSTMLTDEPFAAYMRSVKPPSVVAYRASEPHEVLVPNHTWPRALETRRIPRRVFRAMRASDKDAMQLGHAARGWVADANPAFDSFAERHGMRARSKPPYRTVAAVAAVVEQHTRSRATDVTFETEKRRLLQRLQKYEWRAAVTAKAHYRAGAAWRNLRLAQGAAIAGAGAYVALCQVAALRLPIAVASLLVGSLVTERPSALAETHQRAGARYSGVEMEYGTLAARLRHGRVRIAWAEAYAMNIQRRKTRLDARSPNAPDYFAESAKRDLRHRKPPSSSSSSSAAD